MTWLRRPALPGLALLLCLALWTSACSSADQAPSPTSGSSAPPLPTGEPERLEIETVTTWGVIPRPLAKVERRRTKQAVAELVQGWFNAAYVGGDWPRSHFGDAFPGFTPGARAEARRDQVLMTNKQLGPEITDVTPTTSRIRLDVLAVDKRAVGATARFELGFETTGEKERAVRVTGRLMLSRQDAGWRIFGFDVAKGDRSA